MAVKEQEIEVGPEVKNENPLYPKGGPLSQYDPPKPWWETMSPADKLKLAETMPYGIGRCGVCN